MSTGKAVVIAASLLAVGLLAGCAAPVVPQDKTFGRIADDIQLASESRAGRPEAAQTRAINQALLPPLQIEAPRARQAAEPRFDLAVSSAPAGQVFMALVSGTRYSMLLPAELTGSITVNLKDVTVREALDALRDLYGYEYRIQGTRITVMPNTLQTRLFQVSYLASKRGGTSSTRVASTGMSSSGSSTGGASTGGGTTTGTTAGASQESANVFTGVLTDFWFDLSQALATVLGCEYELTAGGSSPTGTTTQTASTSVAGQLMSQRVSKLKCAEGRSYLINSQSGVVMVRAMPGELREVENLLKALQANIERQVMIEAKIIEVILKDEFNTGVNWAAFDKYGRHRFSVNGNTANFDVSSKSGTTGMTLSGSTGAVSQFSVPGALGLAFQTGDFASLINFLQTQGNVYVMSSPRIATLNNQKAVIKVGSDDYYITGVTASGSTTNTSTAGTTVTLPTIITQPFFSGIALDVTPQIDDQGSITLHIRPLVTEVSEKDKSINLGNAVGSYTIPYASTKVKESDSIVRVRDGMIVAIGGLMSEGQSSTLNKVPGAGDVPVAGNLFKQTARATEKRELVILLKPTLIQDDQDWRQGMQETQERLRDFDPARLRQPMPDIFSKP